MSCINNSLKFTIWDYVIILSIYRGQILKSDLNKTDLIQIAQNISEYEVQCVKYYNGWIKNQIIDDLVENNFKYHSCVSMVSYLENVNIVTFPVPLSYLGNSLKKNKILTYFYLKHCKCEVPKRIFTDSQTDSICNTGLIIVNAGPGTGKTTSSCRRAFHFMNEGVIFISFTNSAVKEDKNRMYEYPTNNKILFCTIDSLAGRILSISGQLNGDSENSYDHNIRSAISTNMVLSGYKHIIVDEAQDVDDLRFELVASLYNSGNFNSLAIFGDPRQRINSMAGNWYKKMWSESESGFYDLSSNSRNSGVRTFRHPIKRIAFLESRRFKSQGICDLVNKLSSRRPELHCDLTITSSNLPEIQSLSLEREKNEEKEKKEKKPILIYNGEVTETFNKITSFIKEMNMSGVPFNEFMVIGPSVDASNQTAKIGKIIRSEFRKAGIPCKMNSEGSYQTNGVLFSTIHSVKGKEADYVIIFGMNAYPETFSMIPYEQAESLIYVAHSRARKQIIYIDLHSNIVLPRGILPEDVKLVNPGMILKENKIKDNNEEREFQFNISELCKDFNYNRLLETNECKVQLRNFDLFFEDLDKKEIKELIELPPMPERSEPADFYGIMTGVAIGMFCENKLPNVMEKLVDGNYKTLNKDEYLKVKLKTFFVDGMLLDTEMLVVKKEVEATIDEIKELFKKSIHELTIQDIYRITVIYIEVTSGYTYFHNSVYDSNLIPYWKKIAKIISYNFGELSSEVKVKYNEITGSIDFLTNEYIIELKTKKQVETQDAIQSQLYSCVMYGYDNMNCKINSKKANKLMNNRNKVPILLNLNTRTCHIVTSNRNRDYWLYITNKYVEITVNQHCLNEMISNSNDYIKIDRQNVFFVDTEYNPHCSSETGKIDCNAIFEISIFNCNDPFRSIVQVVNNTHLNRDFALSWLEIDTKLYDNSPDINSVVRMYLKVVELYNIKPLLYYYNAKMDVSWDYGISEVHDLSVYIAKLCSNRGVLIQSTKPKLIDYYNSHVDFASFRTHLKHHTALSDTIMLYEIMKTIKSG